MTSSGSVFSETLREITNTKLEELSKRRAAFEENKASILASVEGEDDAITRLRTLSAGVKSCFAIKLDKSGTVIRNHTALPQLEIELKNLDRFMGQAKYDPSLSQEMLKSWEQSLHRHLETQSLKYQYASLYGQLVNEWLSGNSNDGVATSEDVSMGEAFEDVGSAQKLEARQEWEKMVFEPAHVNEATLRGYLHRIFGIGDEEKKPTHDALHQLRESIYFFETSMSRPNLFNTSSLKWIIRGLRSSDLLSNEKREVLKDFECNEILLREIADVLNMRINALDSWTWSSEASVPVEVRRRINGNYNIHMHEDLLQAIFLQCIGVKWSVFFKKAFKDFRRFKGAWKSMRKDIPKLDRQRLGYYLGPLQASPCLQAVRTKMYNKKYFLAQLMNDEQQDTKNIEGEEEADYEQAVSGSRKRKRVPMQMARNESTRHRKLAGKAPRKAAPFNGQGGDSDLDFGVEDMIDYSGEEDDSGDCDDEAYDPMALKQTILHLLSTELTINTHLYGEMTAFHSVFQSWNSLLPHETARTILEFLGVSKSWITFFSKFLEAPLKFTDDHKSTQARMRRRGTPASHILSDVFGEVTLFCLDFAVNQATVGDVLWRIHDDVWFWSRDQDVAVKAWKAIEEFATMTGTEINPAKTGSVRVSNDHSQVLPTDQALPEGQIRWGFLKLSPKTGHFEIDQEMVDSHIGELQDQLGNKHGSILGFIHAWNTFAGTFFTSNFGKAANSFGRKHVDNMLSTHERIQRQIFESFTEDAGTKVTSVAEYLKNALSSRFGFQNVPDGYFYFPMELGGLDLQSPFISLLQIRDELLESPAELLDDFKAAERRAYETAQAAFVNGQVKTQRYALDDPEWVPASVHDREVFMPFEEYVQYREYFLFHYHDTRLRLDEVFRRLMERPSEMSLDLDNTKVSVALGQLYSQSNLRGITTDWNTMDPYWRWVAMMYGPEILHRFGSLNIVDSGLLPMGMVSFFKEKRVNWQG